MGLDSRDHVKPSMLIPIPYHGVKLELEPAPFHTWAEVLEFFENEATWEERPRILTSAVLLWHAGAGDIVACLSTAIVWERG